MKEYNRTTKRWEEPDKNGSLKKPETCKGKKPHDFVLLIPQYINRQHLPFSKDQVEEYYAIEDERKMMNEVLDDKLMRLGINQRHYGGRCTRYYVCSVCGKNKYEQSPTPKE